jgi:hypothetical protein
MKLAPRILCCCLLIAGIVALAEAALLLRSARLTVEAATATIEANTKTEHGLDAVEREAAGAVQSLHGALAETGQAIAALKQDGVAAQQTVDGATALLSTLSDGAGGELRRLAEATGNLNALVLSAQPTVKHVNDGTSYLAETLGFIRDDFRPKKRSFWVNLLDKATNGAVSALVSIFLPEHVQVVK